MIDEPTELDAVEWFQDLGGWLEPIMVFFSQLGNPLAFVLFASVVFWCVDSGLGQRMALFTFAAGPALGDFEVEPVWERNVASQIDASEPFDPVDATDIGSTAGIFAGTTIALVLLADRGGLANARNVRVRLTRFVVGLVCLVIALVIVGSLGGMTGLDDADGVVGAAWQFATSGTLGFVIFFTAPRVFERLRLTTPHQSTRGPAMAGSIDE